MDRDPTSLRLSAAAYRELALCNEGTSMKEALYGMVTALEPLASEIEAGFEEQSNNIPTER
jgi:hypothetical protein